MLTVSPIEQLVAHQYTVLRAQFIYTSTKYDRYRVHILDATNQYSMFHIMKCYLLTPLCHISRSWYVQCLWLLYIYINVGVGHVDLYLGN